MLKIPVFVHESNAIAGKTNKMIGKFADGVAVGFENAKKDFDNKNIVVTGNPVRKEFEGVKLVKSDKKTVLIFGGSQGAKNINEAVVNLIKKADGHLPYNLIYATGKKNYDVIMEQIGPLELDNTITIKSYIDDMANVMASADLVVSRAGAITVSELCFIGKPAVLIPLSTAAENHQEFNARVMADKGYAKIILDNECTADRLEKEIEEMLNKDIDGESIKKLMPKDAANNFYEMIKKYIAK